MKRSQNLLCIASDLLPTALFVAELDVGFILRDLLSAFSAKSDEEDRSNHPPIAFGKSPSRAASKTDCRHDNLLPKKRRSCCSLPPKIERTQRSSRPRP